VDHREEMNHLPLPGIQPRPARNSARSVVIQTALFRLIVEEVHDKILAIFFIYQKVCSKWTFCSFFSNHIDNSDLPLKLQRALC
jgi:hypothetical protein